MSLLLMAGLMICRTVLLDELQDQDYGMEPRDDVIVVNNNDEDNEG